jgi:non-canonical purine NTP pyrophosphatase (RdgB/HAM1 family)
MTELIFVTGSTSKFREAAEIMALHGVALVQHDLQLIEPKLDDPRLVVRWKARQAYRRLRRPLFVDDTTLCLAGYPCFPGAYTAAVARTLGPAGLCRLLDPAHRASFTSWVCYHDGRRRTFAGSWSGRMVPSAAFTEGDWPYNAMFVPDGFDRPLAELAAEVRRQHSHRRRALDKLARFLRRPNASREGTNGNV